MDDVIDLRDYKLHKSMHRILRIWDQRADDSSYTTAHRMIARKLAKTYREALAEFAIIEQKQGKIQRVL